MKKFRMTMERRHILEAYVFMTPFIIGVLAFFAFPLFISIKLSFGEIVKMKGFKIKWLGFDHYIKAFVWDVNFAPMLLETIRQVIIQLPLIIVFSLLLAILISRDIKFVGFFRVVFFLPFLLGTGHIMQQILEQGVNMHVLSAARQIILPDEMLIYLGPKVSEMVNNFFGVIVVVLWSSGVQILLFLSGLQSIPESLYEAAKVDGATEWEMFWKITMPMISPIMLLNIIYTLVDSFTDISNPILGYIQTNAFRRTQFEYAAAIGWIYFLFILLLVLLVFLLMRNRIYSTGIEGGSRDENEFN